MRPGIVWAFVGLKEIGLLVVVTLALYGRSGLFKSPYMRLLRPWSDAPRRGSATARPKPGAPSPTRGPASPSPTPPPASSRRDDRLFWFLTILAAGVLAGGRNAGLNVAVAPDGRPETVSRIELESAPLIGLKAKENCAGLPA